MQSRTCHKRFATHVHARAAGLLVCVIVLMGYPTAKAEISEVGIVRQFGIHYLPLVIMEHERLVEKVSVAEGLKDLKVIMDTAFGWRDGQ